MTKLSAWSTLLIFHEPHSFEDSRNQHPADFKSAFWKGNPLVSKGARPCCDEFYRHFYRQGGRLQHWRRFAGDTKKSHLSKSIDIYRLPNASSIASTVSAARFSSAKAGNSLRSLFDTLPPLSRSDRIAAGYRYRDRRWLDAASMGGYYGDGRTRVRPHVDSVVGAFALSAGQFGGALIIVRGATHGTFRHKRTGSNGALAWPEMQVGIAPHASGRLSKKKQSGRMAEAM